MQESDFSPDEWQTLRFCPFWVFHAVGIADGKVDKKELGAFLKEVQEAPLFKDALARNVLFSIAANLDAVFKAYHADPRNVMDGLGQAADLLDRRATPETVKGFKGSMLLIGHRVAEASGGLLGMGKKVSDKEKSALLLVRAALRAL
jgi:hypothetical protein